MADAPRSDGHGATDAPAPADPPDASDSFGEAGSAGSAGTGRTATGTSERELRKDNDAQVLAGVCSGLGRYTDIDPVVWRAAFALTTFAGGTGLFLYVAAWMLMRDSQGGPATIEQMLDRGIPSQAVLKLLALGLAAATAFSLIGGFGWGTLVLATPLILGVLVARNREVDLRSAFLELREDLRKQQPPPATPAPQPTPAYYNPAQPWASAPQGPVDLAVVSERTTHGLEPGTEDEDDEDDGDDEEEGEEEEGDESGAEDDEGEREPGTGTEPERKRLSLASCAIWTVVVLGIVAPIVVYGTESSLWSAETVQLLFGPETGVFFLAAVLGIIGFYSVIGTWAGNSKGLMFMGAVTTLVLLMGSAADLTKIGVVDGATWQPATVAEAEEEEHRLTLGAGTLDLTALSDLEPGESVDVSADVLAGTTTVLVPEDVRVDVDSQVRLLGLVNAWEGEEHEATLFGYSLSYSEAHEPVTEFVAGPDEGGDADSAGTEADAEADGEATEDGVGAEPPTINVHTDSRIGYVEVRYGQA